MNLEVENRKRLFRSIKVGNIERVREVLAGNRLEIGGPPDADGNAAIERVILIKPVDANTRDRRGRPALIVAVRAMIPESGVVEALLEYGADPRATDADGLTALDYGRRRLERLGPGPDRVRKSRSLDAHGNLRLSKEERDMMEEWRREVPDMADEAIEMYTQERRKAALRQFMPRRELRIIVQRLEELTGS